MRPQENAGGGTPSPRKLRLASVRIAVPTPSEAWTRRADDHPRGFEAGQDGRPGGAADSSRRPGGSRHHDDPRRPEERRAPVDDAHGAVPRDPVDRVVQVDDDGAAGRVERDWMPRGPATTGDPARGRMFPAGLS